MPYAVTPAPIGQSAPNAGNDDPTPISTIVAIPKTSGKRSLRSNLRVAGAWWLACHP
jgi:hypothetical protein